MFVFFLLVSCLVPSGQITFSLSHAAAEQPVAIDDLLATIDRGQTQDARLEAIHALSKRTFLPRKAPPIVLKAVKDPHKETRVAIAELLARFYDNQSIRSLIGVAELDPESSVRMAAINSIAKLGPVAKEAIPCLVSVVKGSHDGRLTDVQRSAARALLAIGGEGAVRLAGIAMDRQCDVSIRCLAIDSICKLRANSRVIPCLVKLASDPDKAIRLYIIERFERIDPLPREIKRALYGALADQSSYIRVVAAAAMHVIDKDNVITIPLLIQALNDTDEDTQWRAIEELGLIGGEAASAAQAIARMLDSPNERIRAVSAEALGAIGPGAHTTLPKLVEATRDDSEDVRNAAKRAIDQIRGKSKK